MTRDFKYVNGVGRLSRRSALLAAATVSLAALVTGLSPLRSAESPSPAAEPGMKIGVSTHFGQNWPLDMLTSARSVEATFFRDTISWDNVEVSKGAYVFNRPNTVYPEALDDFGARTTLTFNWGNAFYDNGDTPYSEEARRAQARFIESTLARYKNVDVIEIGNEFNGNNFVTGPIREQSGAERAESYVRMLAPIAEGVRSARPDVKILGGATHSIPVGYIEQLIEAGAMDYMDGLAIHPYTTPPEQLERQVAYLRSRLPDPAMPIFATEFGSTNENFAADYMVKMYSVMSAAGIEHAIWYPLRRQGNSTSVPLVANNGAVTSAGEAYAFIQRDLSDARFRDVSPDPFTYAFQAGRSTVVLWGEPRSFSVRNPQIAVYSAEGDRIAPPASLDMDTVLILVSESGIDLANDIELGPNRLVADSYHQFEYVDRPGKENAFERYFLVNGERRPAEIMGGGERSGTIWTPYFGNPYLRPARIAADGMIPAVFDPGTESQKTVSIVHSYVADRDMSLNVRSEWVTSDRTDDGVTVRICLNDRTLDEQLVMGTAQIGLKTIDVNKGDRLDFILSPNANSEGDGTSYRIRLFEN